MPVSKADQRAVAKYVKNNYDRIEVKVPKGRKAVIQAAGTAVGESLNGYVSKAIDERIARQEAVSAFTVQPTDKEEANEET